MSTTKKHDSGTGEGVRRATEQSPESSVAAGESGRGSSQCKLAVILEVLRGGDLVATSRKHRVTIATLTEWRDRFLAGGEASLKSRDPEDEEKRRLKSAIANVTVESEFLREKIAQMVKGRPLVLRKLKR